MFIQDISWWLVLLIVAHVVLIAAGSSSLTPQRLRQLEKVLWPLAGMNPASASCKPSTARTHSFTSVLPVSCDMFCCHPLQMERCLPQTFQRRTIIASTADSRFFPTLFEQVRISTRPQRICGAGAMAQVVLPYDRYAQPRPLSARASVQELGTACDTPAILVNSYLPVK